MTHGPTDPGMGSRGVLFLANGVGKSSVLARWIAEAADASGAGRGTLQTVFVSYRYHNADSAWSSFFREPRCLRNSDWEVDWSGFGPAGLSLEWLVAGVSGSRAVRSVDPTALFFAAVESAAATVRFRVVDPVEAMLRSLRRLIRLGRRADASRQLAVQRLRFASRAAKLPPDAPPGEVVVSSSCVPRGPDMPRVISTVVDHSRVSSPV